jgi:hypothetical protein
LPDGWDTIIVADISVSGDILLVETIRGEVAVSRNGTIAGVWHVDGLGSMGGVGAFPAVFSPDGLVAIAPTGGAAAGLAVIHLSESEQPPDIIQLATLSHVRAIEPFADGKRIAVALNDNRIYIVDRETGESRSFPSYYRTADRLALAQEDSLLFSLAGSYIDVFDIETGELFFGDGEDWRPLQIEGLDVPNMGSGVQVSADTSTAVTSAFNRLIVYQIPLGFAEIVKAVCDRLPEHTLQRQAGATSEPSALDDCR